AVRAGPDGPRGRRPVQRLQRRGRGSQLREEPPARGGADLRPLHPGGTRIRPGREGLKPPERTGLPNGPGTRYTSRLPAPGSRVTALAAAKAAFRAVGTATPGRALPWMECSRPDGEPERRLHPERSEHGK